MKASFREIPGSIIAPKGFRAAGVFCDIKRLGTGKGSNKGQKRDLAVIVSDRSATAAGMFTTNQVCAAPVKICAERIRHGKAQAIVVNSGNANACTGKQGMKDARTMADLAARKLEVAPGLVLVGSTGRIGVPLPMPNVGRGINSALAALGSGPEHAAQVAEAIMTSDTRPKQIAVEFSLGGKRARIGGVCKGAGMIQPGMSTTGKRPAALHATMLCFITTDAAMTPAALQLALEQAVAQSFNRITVDGDMSTNDTVLILANGASAGNVRRNPDVFQAALNHVTLELAKMIVRDGEGVSRVVTVRVEGAKSVTEADAAARAIANSALVKTSWCGGDPNWGRILGALGYSSAEVVEEKIDVAYSLPGSAKRLFALRNGQPTATSFEELCRLVAEKEFELHINLNLGKGSAVMYASDLTEDYVDFNKGDVTDPASLGG
ncbi:MAG TPA: bifunctional glutamate N-acetyltransferase/amino-acid acetyltransferase ArgJ [Verrucomicrobiae bacterium]|nr:bifunctional glutamate N-acetyltransferase/amino-acid acetyltransferase ArgJ [Verrucomicrobiae bacterium]